MIKIKFWLFKVKKLKVKDDKEFWKLYNELKQPETFEDFVKLLIEQNYLERFLNLILEDTLWNKILKKFGIQFSIDDVGNDDLIKVLEIFFTKNEKFLNILNYFASLSVLILNTMKKGV